MGNRKRAAKYFGLVSTALLVGGLVWGAVLSAVWAGDPLLVEKVPYVYQRERLD